MCLYRHKINDSTYGIKKLRGKRKERSLFTTDRKTAGLSLNKCPGAFGKEYARCAEWGKRNEFAPEDAVHRGRKLMCESLKSELWRVFQVTCFGGG